MSDPAPSRLERRVIVVTGMHRSGTSAVTRVLNLLGIDLPAKVGDPGPDNETGYWEPIEIVSGNDRLLRAAGSAWDDVSPVEPSWFGTPQARQFEDELLDMLGHNYGDSRLFVLKDARICRLLPSWLKVLERFGSEPSFVLPIRNPLEVADSLLRRNGFTTSKSLLLWMWHTIAAEKSTRGHPRSFVSYDRLLADWPAVASTVSDELGLSWPSLPEEARVEIDRFLSPSHRHHVATADDLERSPVVSSHMQQVYRTLAQAANTPGEDLSHADRVFLGRAHRALKDSHALYGSLLGDSSGRVVTSLPEQQMFVDEVERRTGEVAPQPSGHEPPGSDARQEIDALTGQLVLLQDEVRAVRVDSEESARRTHGLLEAFTRELQDRESAASSARTAELEQETARLREELAAARADAAAHAREAADELVEAREELAREAAEELAQVREELAGRHLALQRAEDRIKALDAELAQAQGLVGWAQDEFEAQEGRHAEALACAASARETLADELAQRDGKISALEAELAKSESRVAWVRSEREREQQSASERLEQAEARIGRLQTHVDEHQRALAARDEDVVALGYEAKERERELSLREKEVRELREALRTANERLRGLKASRGPGSSTAQAPSSGRQWWKPATSWARPADLPALPPPETSASAPAEPDPAPVEPTPAPAPMPRVDAHIVQDVTGAAAPTADASAASDGDEPWLTVVPRGATVLFVDQGDRSGSGLSAPERRVWRFWPVGDGSSGEAQEREPDQHAISAVGVLRAQGASHLVFAGAATDLLEDLPAFRAHLDSAYRLLLTGDQAIVYSLVSRPRQERQRRVPDHWRSGRTGLDVVCFPIIDWRYRFQRPQQLLVQFANRGHRVFYVATTLQRDRPEPVIETLAEGVWSVRLPGPPQTSLYSDVMAPEVREEIVGALASLAGDARIRDAMAIVDLPFWGPAVFEAQRRWNWKVVYDCMDEHAGFTDEGNAEARSRIARQEQAMLADSDLVIATSKMLHEKARPAARRCILVPNAADFEHFSYARRGGPLPPSLPRPIVGYYGAISSWFDVDMVAHAAAERPEWTFVMAGSTVGADVEPLEQLSNVHLLGELTYEDVPPLLHQFDVACIPFKLIDLTLATNPVKFYEYLSAGKPVVSVKLPELEPYEGYYYPVASREEFNAQVERALAEDNADRRVARVQLGRDNTWSSRYEAIEAATRRWYKKATVIIPSFNNPELLRLCLESLTGKTQYPNFDVIVVDNGSEAELVEELEGRAKSDSRLRVILNGENIGFAAANNVAIRAAEDADYIVLLNDDTVVTRGWLGRLLSYFENDKSIGMVGPLTNWTGNEARIPVDYGEDLQGLEEFADRRADDYHGQLFDIAVLAMYCVAFSRETVLRVGGLNEDYRVGMFEDDDFAMRVRQAGLRVVCAEDVFIHHWGRASFKRMDEDEYTRLFEENKRVFEETWGQSWVPHRARPDQG